MIDYERDLNEEQRRVVMEDQGPLLVIAGAGSGKTRTLTYRVARLIEDGVSPAEILLATFTNKAARAMLTRVRELACREIETLWGGTFHHIGHLLLRRHAELLGYERSFSIMDGEDARQLMTACLTDLGIDTRGGAFPKGNVIAEMVSLSVNTQTPLAEVVQGRYPFFASSMEDITRVSARYHARKESLQMMDFDDLLFLSLRLLADHPEILARYANRFRHVLVDEYQDTNLIQAQLVDLLASEHRNLMAVGDDSQSIYSFRGANFENILQFPEKYPDCRIFKLETNYRSTPEILHLANLSIVKNERQFQKTLQPTKKAGIRPVLVETRTVTQQADFTTQRIIELIRGGTPPQEIAVLYRAHYHSMELQMEMVRRGIPFEIRSGIRFFEQAHIKDVTAYLRIGANPRDELAWKRVLGLCNRVGKATANKVWSFLARQEEPLVSALTDGFLSSAPASARPGLAGLQRVLRQIWGTQALPPEEVIVSIMDAGYRQSLQERYTDAAMREDDLRELAVFSGRFANTEDFLGEMALLSSVTEDEPEREDRKNGRIVLSTIHQAKGLEWSAVFLLWCADGMIPLARALKEPGGEEEERRLFYVAATRAKDHLYLCYPLTDYTRGMGNMPLRPSRFLRELPSPYDEGSCPYELWVIDED